MSPLNHFVVVAATLTLLASGCCTLPRCGVVGTCDGLATDLAVPPICDIGCGGCDSCGTGSVVPCGYGGCLGLGCIGKLLSIGHYGCTSCAAGGGGCGEVYFHDWINEPPCPDPCNVTGTWTDSCGGCASGCDSCFGVASCGTPCPRIAGYGPRCSGFQIPGRVLYKTWMGVGGILHGIRYGLLPSCQRCNTFSFSHTCTDCVGTGGYGYGGAAPGVTPDSPYFGGAGQIGCTSCTGTGTSHDGHVVADGGEIPHHVTNDIRATHGRPPHKVIAERIR